MYGYTALAEIMPEVAKIGAAAIDIWPKVHGNQREQLEQMGEQSFADLLTEHEIRLGCITQYKLGPFGLTDELPLAKRLGCSTIVTGGKGPKGLKGNELKQGVQHFVNQMQPHLAIAQANGVTIAIENHGGNLFRIRRRTEMAGRPLSGSTPGGGPGTVPFASGRNTACRPDSYIGKSNRSVLCVAAWHGVYAKAAERAGTPANAGTPVHWTSVPS